ncbi:hypothetical protein MBLNU230_g2524t1 [Neophaeotheca triangularis]
MSSTAEDKENMAPLTSSDPLQRKGNRSPSPKKASKKTRSHSIGPGGLDGPDNTDNDVKNRRKSAFPATKSILPTKDEEAERKAARRKSLANRRVSFAPEATLHTWDVVEYMRDHTTSTESSDSTRRASNMTRHTPEPSPSSPMASSDDEDDGPPSTPPEQADEVESSPTEPAHQRDLHQKKRRRSSGIPPMNFNDPNEAFSSSPNAGSSDVSEDEDDTGTAMSIDMGDEETARSAGSGSSTGSSRALDAALRQAAQQAGTRGIEYDEYGDMSMEIAGDEVTNAFKPWAQRGEQSLGSASMDQENINPFSPAFKAELVAEKRPRPETIQEEEEGDETTMSMDVTRAVGGIVKDQRAEPPSSPFGDGTMDITQAVGKIHHKMLAQSPKGNTGQKRGRSTTVDGSPGVDEQVASTKRRRSSVARSSFGDETMDLTVAMGGIQHTGSPAKPARRRSVGKRRSSGVFSEQEDATMDMTRAVGGIQPKDKQKLEESFDENEELTMELTTAIGGIGNDQPKAEADKAPSTPSSKTRSPGGSAATTPKDQEPFQASAESGPVKNLTPVSQKQTPQIPDHSSGRTTRSAGRAKPAQALEELRHSSPKNVTPEASLSAKGIVEDGKDSSQRGSPSEGPVNYPGLPALEQDELPRTDPVNEGDQTSNPGPTSSEVRHQANSQQPQVELSPSVEKQQRTTPKKQATRFEASTPEDQGSPSRAINIADSLKLMSTPRKETLKNSTPKKQTPSKPTPRKMATPRSKLTPKPRSQAPASPARQLSDDISKSAGKHVPKVRLNEFLDMAGIRFMELTTTKRRMTVAPTPSKARRESLQNGEDVPSEPEVNLETAVTAAACTEPELDMYAHACRELKHYTSEGKAIIKELEAETYHQTPPLIQAYLSAAPERKTAIDAQLRDMKTQARFRSKEMWYAWRGQLLDDLMKGLQGIGEGLIQDDEMLQRSEQILEQVLPHLLERGDQLKHEAERLEEAASAVTAEEKEELEAARERMQAADQELDEKRKLLQEMEQELQAYEQKAGDLRESKDEFAAAIQEADRVRDSCRTVSAEEVASLQERVQHLEDTYKWTINSASSSPATVTMTYKQDLQVFFHPRAFSNDSARPNSPISLTYIANEHPYNPRKMTTTLRFFLQFLRASLQALPQCETRIQDLLSLVSSGWDTALEVVEAQRRLSLQHPTEARIVSDERLAISTSILLPKVRTKVSANFEVAVTVGEGLMLSCTVEPGVRVVYGEKYKEEKMRQFVSERTGDSVRGWDGAVAELREKLIIRGAKGAATPKR